MKGLVALEGQEPVGYILAFGSRIVQCYANNVETAWFVAIIFLIE